MTNTIERVVTSGVYTVSDIEMILQIGHNSAYALADGKNFPVIHIGKKIRIPIKSFEEWMSNPMGGVR